MIFVGRFPSGNPIIAPASFLLGRFASLHALQPLDGHLGDPAGVVPFHDCKRTVPDRLDAALVARIIRVDDDIAGMQLRVSENAGHDGCLCAEASAPSGSG